jgi:IMP cyclohydrolase
MVNGLKKLSSLEYPGRLIILGKDLSGSYVVVVYAVTGRSPSSQARKIITKKNGAWVEPYDEMTLRKGNVDLLVYPAIQISKGIAVSNGKHTSAIRDCLAQQKNPVEVLSNALENWDYEPDAPNYTPRISGCIIKPEKAALSIIKRELDGSSQKNYYEISLIDGKGKMIATYTGENFNPLPSFRGEPLDVDLNENSTEETAEAVYEALSPKNPEKDYRVSVAVLFADTTKFEKYAITIINRHDRKE